MSKCAAATLACVLLYASLPVSAQADAAADADATPPAPTCSKPDLPGMQPSDYQVKSFNRAYTAYKKCVQVYVDDRQAAIKRHEDIAKANQAAAQKLLDEYNKVNDQVKSLSGEDDQK